MIVDLVNCSHVVSMSGLCCLQEVFREESFCDFCGFTASAIAVDNIMGLIYNKEALTTNVFLLQVVGCFPF